MSLLRIGIMPERFIAGRLSAIASGAYEPDDLEPQKWYASLAVLAEVLTPQNLDLLTVINKEAFQDLAELAERRGLTVDKLIRDLEVLEREGFLKFEEIAANNFIPVSLYTDFEIETGMELFDVYKERLKMS